MIDYNYYICRFLREANSLMGETNVGDTVLEGSIIGMSSPVSMKSRPNVEMPTASLNGPASSSSSSTSSITNSVSYVMVDQAKTNLDVLNRVSSDTQKIFKTLQSAAQQLQSKEFHQLAIQYKVSILRVLVLSCYETDLFRRIMESNAKIREERISALAKQAREEAQKKRDLIAQVSSYMHINMHTYVYIYIYIYIYICTHMVMYVCSSKLIHAYTQYIYLLMNACMIVGWQEGNCN